MNSLQVDPTTGFLQNNFTSHYGFTVDKKLHFLELATQYRKDGKFPKVSAICDQIGINIRSFERHLELDEKFAAEWKEISTHVEYDCISDMSELRKKNPMYMFGLLRYLNPKRWNPDSKLSVQVDIKATDGLIDRAQSVEAEICPASAPQTEGLPSEKHILAEDTSKESPR